MLPSFTIFIRILLTFFVMVFFFPQTLNPHGVKFTIIISPQDVSYALSTEKADFRRVSPSNRCFRFPISQVSPSLRLSLEGLILVDLGSNNTFVFYILLVSGPQMLCLPLLLLLPNNHHLPHLPPPQLKAEGILSPSCPFRSPPQLKAECILSPSFPFLSPPQLKAECILITKP